MNVIDGLQRTDVYDAKRVAEHEDVIMLFRILVDGNVDGHFSDDHDVFAVYRTGVYLRDCIIDVCHAIIPLKRLRRFQLANSHSYLLPQFRGYIVCVAAGDLKQRIINMHAVNDR